MNQSTPPHVGNPLKTGTPGLRYGELVERRAQRQPLRTAVICDGAAWTYAELSARIIAAAAELSNQGVGAGDRVVCWAENCAEVLVAVYAASRIGAIFTPVGASAKPADVAFIIRDLEAHTLLVSAATAAAAHSIDGVQGVRLIALKPDADCSTGHLPTSTGNVVPPHEPAPDSPALVVYTSGTTGNPKGVVLSHEALFFNSVNTLLGLDITSDDVTLVNTPLSHIAALNTLAINTLHKGGTVVIDIKFDAELCIEQIERLGVTTMFAVPAMLALMLRSATFGEADLSSLRWILAGGAPVSPALVTQWAERNVPVLTSYGLTEAGPSASFRHAVDVHAQPSSSGPPALLTDVRIVRPDGDQVSAGEVGEILLRGPHIASGYWRNDGATEAAFGGGWLKTGDRGLLGQNGDLFITGRSKDIIITGGENVDPAEIEHLLVQHPRISDAAVIGRPDAVWGEVVVAVVVADQPVDLADLRSFLASRLAKYKIPRAIEYRDTLPRNITGKLLRSMLTTPTDPTQ